MTRQVRFREGYSESRRAACGHILSRLLCAHWCRPHCSGAFSKADIAAIDRDGATAKRSRMSEVAFTNRARCRFWQGGLCKRSGTPLGGNLQTRWRDSEWVPRDFDRNSWQHTGPSLLDPNCRTIESERARGWHTVELWQGAWRIAEVGPAKRCARQEPEKVHVYGHERRCAPICAMMAASIP